jgi:ABC-type glycerol-3-phosphate transport system substrate-binding protein
MELAVDNYNYRFLYGDLHISNLGRAGTVYYNKELYSQYVSANKDKDELYQVVLDNRWTVEEFIRLAKKGYVAKGGDGSNDIYGYDHHQAANLDFLRESSGIRMYERNEYGMPTFNFKNDKSVDFITTISDFLYNSPGILCSTVNKDVTPPVFTDSQVVFYINILSSVMNDAMREMKDDFGILPMPKWDEEQEEYKTLIYNASCTAGIPVSTDIDRANEEVSAVIEALCSESYRSVSLAFYETALKAAYNRDDQSAQMIDIITAQHPTIKSSLTKNFVFEYSSSLGSIGTIFTDLVRYKSTNFISQYDSTIGAAEQGLKDLIALYKSGKI